MPVRNEHNAIIFGGTMGLIRRSVLGEIGGWDEWCITEDAEASLRILKRGYRSIYLHQTYGRGLMPLNFEGLKKQRFRWCFGGIQILRKHWEALMPWARWSDPENRLTPAQQYFYLAGGVQWYNELLMLVFTALLALGGLTTILGVGLTVRPLEGALIAVPLVFLVLGLWRFGWALRHALQVGWGRALRAMGSFFSLSWVVALGSVQGLIQPRGVFLRTPKAKSRSSWVRALRVTQWETGIGAVCARIGLALIVTHPAWTTAVAALLLVWQAGFYLAAPAYSLMSVRGEAQPAPLTSRGDIQGRLITEARAGRWALALVALLLIGYGLLRSLPEPAEVPGYARLQPAAVQPQELVGLPARPTATRLPRLSPTAAPASATLPPTLMPPAASSVAPVIAPATVTPPPAPSPTETPAPAQPPAETLAPALTSTSPSPPSPSPESIQPPEPTATETPAPTPTPPTPPVPTQAPAQPTLPSQAPTQRPAPTQVFTPPSPPTPSSPEPPVPTGIPTQPSPPTQVPPQPPIPTPPARPG